MGSDCQSTLFINFSLESLFVQLPVVIVTIWTVLRVKYGWRFPQRFMKFTTCMMFVSLHCLVLQGVCSLTVMIYIPRMCSSGGSLGQDPVYILYWCVTAVKLLLVLLLIFLDIGLAVVYLEKPDDLHRELNWGPWFDRKKRAALLQKLIRCAGTKEGCRLLATEYCERLCRDRELLTHGIVLNYIWDVCLRKGSKLPVVKSASRKCGICEEQMKSTDMVFYWRRSFGQGILMYHACCMQALTSDQLLGIIEGSKGKADLKEFLKDLEHHVKV